MRLANRAAIVTGGANGIGLAIARRFVQEGAHVLIGDVDEAAGEEAARQLGARFERADVGVAEDARRLVAASMEHFGRLDILVDNAGIVHTADFLDLREEDFDRVLRVNLKGPFLMTQAAAREMVRQVEAGGKPGTVINMSSVNAVLAIPNLVPYNVSKGGLAQLTRVTALALAPYGIRVNAIGPGSIATEMLTSVARNPEAKHRLLSRTPLLRFGQPEEIAAIAAFLASDDASYITGQTIYADGGRLPLNYVVPVPEGV